MQLSQKENTIVHNAIHYLATKNALYPKFLGDLGSNSPDVKDLEDGYFAAWFVDNKLSVCANFSKISVVVNAICLSRNTVLSPDEHLRVCDGLTKEVDRHYKDFIGAAGFKEVKNIFISSNTLH